MTASGTTHADRFAQFGPYILLSFSILCWSGNFVVGRFANLDAPPIALSFWRHVIAAFLVAPFLVSTMREDWPAIRHNLTPLAILSALFVAGNTFVYFSILHTTVINAALINAGVPVAAAFFSWIFLRDVINRWQALGILACFTGIATVVSQARIEVLLSLEFEWGDLFMLGAVLCWALYMVLFKRAGITISPWTLLLVLAAGGSVWLLPFLAYEASFVRSMSWSAVTLASLAYVSVLSTIAAWACWNYGTLRLGPNRASAFMCLHPVFGPILGMIFFGEILYPYHGFGAALVLAGIVMVSRNYSTGQFGREA